MFFRVFCLGKWSVRVYVCVVLVLCKWRWRWRRRRVCVHVSGKRPRCPREPRCRWRAQMKEVGGPRDAFHLYVHNTKWTWRQGLVCVWKMCIVRRMGGKVRWKRAFWFLKHVRPLCLPPKYITQHARTESAQREYYARCALEPISWGGWNIRHCYRCVILLCD